MSVKVRVYIHGNDAWRDKNVCIDLQLPTTPRKGEFIELSLPELLELEGQAKKSREIAYRYYDWCRIHTYRPFEEFTEEDVESLTFDQGFLEVENIYMSSENDYVSVLLANPNSE